MPASIAIAQTGAPAQQPPPPSVETGVTAILPNGREIRPAGNWLQTGPYPFALAVRPDGSQIAIPSIGFPFALNIVDSPTSASPTITRMPKGEYNDPKIEVHAGVAYSPDGKFLYVATGNSGKVRIYSTATWQPTGEISLDGETGGKMYEKSFSATLTASRDGKTIYVLDQANWRIVVLRVSPLDHFRAQGVKLARIASIATGRTPYGIALSPDGQRLYVTNTGLFEYVPIPGPANYERGGKDDPGLRFPPFGYPSKTAREGTIIDGKKIPGLGDENSPDGSSLWTFDVTNPSQPRLTAKLRLGARISETPGLTVGGAAPTGVVASADAVYVALAHDDAVAKITPDGTKLLAQAALTPFRGPKFEDRKGRPLRGVMPSGLGLKNGRLYVAESGINAVAVLDATNLAVLEHIPVGWNPSAIDFSPDGKFLYVTNAKGKGAGPNGGKNHNPWAPTYVGSLDYGSLSIIDLSALPAPQSLTQTVVDTNEAAIVRRPELPRLRHCFLIIRENRTYDEILGDIKGANGDPALARWGIDGWLQEDPTILHVKVTPNLHALAAQYAISDNFYVDSDVSADGHRWVVGANPTPFFNTAWSSAYGGRRHSNTHPMFGGADAPMPEDEPEFGTLWEHIADAYKGQRGILNYGEGLEIEGSDERAGAEPEGQRLYLNSPLPEPVFEDSDRKFPTFNLGIPDQLRFEEFKKDFSARLAKHEIPALIVIRLPNDHTANPRPGDGYPYRASYVADNDLALGKIIAYLSTTSIWKESAVFVTEDDAQGGVDHVDAHRSILLVASPWVKPGSVSHSHSDFGSITRTIDELLGLGPNNLEDALAGDLLGIFDTHPHLEPFSAVPVDPRVFVPENAKVAKPRTRREAAELLDMDDADAIHKQMVKSRPFLTRPKDDN